MMMWLMGMLSSRRVKPRGQSNCRALDAKGARQRHAQHELHEETDQAHDDEAGSRAASHLQKLCARVRRHGQALGRCGQENTGCLETRHPRALHKKPARRPAGRLTLRAVRARRSAGRGQGKAAGERHNAVPNSVAPARCDCSRGVEARTTERGDLSGVSARRGRTLAVRLGAALHQAVAVLRELLHRLHGDVHHVHVDGRVRTRRTLHAAGASGEGGGPCSAGGGRGVRRPRLGGGQHLQTRVLLQDEPGRPAQDSGAGVCGFWGAHCSAARLSCRSHAPRNANPRNAFRIPGRAARGCVS